MCVNHSPKNISNIRSDLFAGSDREDMLSVRKKHSATSQATKQNGCLIHSIHRG